MGRQSVPVYQCTGNFHKYTRAHTRICFRKVLVRWYTGTLSCFTNRHIFSRVFRGSFAGLPQVVRRSPAGRSSLLGKEGAGHQRRCGLQAAPIKDAGKGMANVHQRPVGAKKRYHPRQQSFLLSPTGRHNSILNRWVNMRKGVLPYSTR